MYDNKMKSSEKCFLEILHSTNNIKKEKDKGLSQCKSTFTWCKLKNFKGTDYYLEGMISINNDITMHYFFSNKRSCISLISKVNKTKLDDINRILVLYSEYFFKIYSIDVFINNLVNTN
jgi:hypothetical protein